MAKPTDEEKGLRFNKGKDPWEFIAPETALTIIRERFLPLGGKVTKKRAVELALSWKSKTLNRKAELKTLVTLFDLLSILLMDDPLGRESTEHCFEINSDNFLYRFNSLHWFTKVAYSGLFKYPRRNWEKGLKFDDTIASFMRHINKYLRGEGHDEESNLYHLGHAVWNIFVLIHFTLHNRTDLDNRNITLEDEKPKRGRR